MEAPTPSGRDCPTMKEALLKVCHTCLGSCLRDEPWQDLGYPRRPKHGAAFQRFRPAWKVALEKSILREMIALFTTAHVRAGVIPENDIDDVVYIYANGWGPVTDLFRTLGYSSAGEAAPHLRASVHAYVTAAPGDWPRVLVARLGATGLPDQRFAARLIAGSAIFALNVDKMVTVLRAKVGE